MREKKLHIYDRGDQLSLINKDTERKTMSIKRYVDYSTWQTINNTISPGNRYYQNSWFLEFENASHTTLPRFTASSEFF